MRIPFKREVNQELFYAILGDFYDTIKYEDEVEFSNAVFEIREFNYEGNIRPNLLHKPSGFMLWWYKHPLRSPEVNMNITFEEFRSILYDCYNSVTSGGQYDIKKWWLPEEEKELLSDLMEE